MTSSSRGAPTSAASASSSANRLVARRHELGEPVGDLAAATLELGDVGLHGLGALHHLELDLLEVCLAPGQGLELVLDGGEVLGRADAGVEALLVARGAVTHLLDVPVGLDDLSLDVAELRARAHELVVEQGGLALEVRDLGELREGPAGVLDLRQARVEGLEVEQLGLLARFGFHGIPPAVVAPTVKVHGSVRTVLMSTSTLRAATRASRRIGNHTDSLDQWPASTR